MGASDAHERLWSDAKDRVVGAGRRPHKVMNQDIFVKKNKGQRARVPDGTDATNAKSCCVFDKDGVRLFRFLTHIRADFFLVHPVGARGQDQNSVLCFLCFKQKRLHDLARRASDGVGRVLRRRVI